MEKNYNEIKKALLELPIKERNEIINDIQHDDIKIKDEQLREIVEPRQNLVGKCFKRLVDDYSKQYWKYYKIISPRAFNEHHISVLTFNEYPTYWFDYQSHLTHVAGDYYLGSFDFNGIEVDDYPIFTSFCPNDMIDITIEEYNAAMDLYIKRLQKMEWVADHDRCGGPVRGAEKPVEEGE